MQETQRNQEIADSICRDLRWNGREFAVDDCVALLNGQIVAVTGSIDDALRELRVLEADPSRGMLFEVHPPVVNVIR